MNDFVYVYVVTPEPMIIRKYTNKCVYIQQNNY